MRGGVDCIDMRRILPAALAFAGAAGAATLTLEQVLVEHVSISPDGKEAVFSSNQDDIDRCHIRRVPVAGGPPRAELHGFLRHASWLRAYHAAADFFHRKL